MATQFPFPSVKSIQELYDYDSVFDFLGHGEFATVFRATRRVTSNNMVAGEEVALKILPKSKVDSEKAARAIINEVENLRRIRHRHCVTLREVLQSEREIYVVLPLVKDAGELFSVIHGSLSERTAATITKQILRALRYLHVDRRIVHRDLKPENIMVSPKKIPSGGLQPDDIRITLVDFGLSKFIGSTQRRRITLRNALPPMMRSNFQAALAASGQLATSMSTESLDSVGSHTNSPVLTTPVGTLRYSAPETLRGVLEHGESPRQTTRGNLQKVDIYSVGIIAHIMLSGLMPFSGKTKQQLTAQMEAGPTFAAAQWSNKISPSAKDFVQKLMGTDPGARPTAEQALRHPWILEMAAKDEDDTKEEAKSVNNGMQSPASSGVGQNLIAAKPQQPRVDRDVEGDNHQNNAADDAPGFEGIGNRTELNDAFNAIMQQELESVDPSGSDSTGDTIQTPLTTAAPLAMCVSQQMGGSGAGATAGSSTPPTMTSLAAHSPTGCVTPSKSTFSYFGYVGQSPVKAAPPRTASTNPEVEAPGPE